MNQSDRGQFRLASGRLIFGQARKIGEDGRQFRRRLCTVLVFARGQAA